MNVTAVIAEYNPFHNGHLYQLDTIRKEHGADYIIVVMGGNFMQRGIPAIADKYERCKMALLNGADLVFELPVYFALGSAEYFAQGAVSLIDRLGIADFLHFGSESGDIAPLFECARIAAHESGTYRLLLRGALKRGASFPAARIQALSDVFPDMDIQNILDTPNNILGIEYIKALIRQNSTVKPVTLARKGGEYTSGSLPADGFASANAIRNALYAQSHETVKKHVPESVYALLGRDFLCADDFSEILLYKLLQLSSKNGKNALAGYYDIGTQLSHTLYNRLADFTSFDGFARVCKTKNLTHSRICRGLMHILLDMTQEAADALKDGGYAQYARLLGFTAHGHTLLKRVKANSSIPVITKPIRDGKRLCRSALLSLNADIYAAQLYYMVQGQKYKRRAKNEYTQEIVRL